MDHYITTRDPERLRTWQQLFGTDRLPVYAPKPRWQPIMVCGRIHLTPAYDCDLRSLGQGAIDRYSAWIAGRDRRPYNEVKAEVEAMVSIPIRAANCEVVATAEERTSPLFDFSWLFGRKRSLVRIVRQLSHQKHAPDVGICWKM